MSNNVKSKLPESPSQESDSLGNAFSNTTNPIVTLEPEFIENTFSYTTKPTKHGSLSQDCCPLKIENDLLSNMTKPTLLGTLIQYYTASFTKTGFWPKH